MEVDGKGDAYEEQEVNGVTGRMPVLTADADSAKVDDAGMLYKETDIDGVTARMPVVAIEGGGSGTTPAQVQTMIDAHNVSPTVHEGIRNDIAAANLNIANTGVELQEHEGNTTIHVTAEDRARWDNREQGKVFDTEADMQAWIAIPANAATLIIGQTLFIRDDESPDYWWDGTQALPLDQKTDLTNYYTKPEVDGIVNSASSSLHNADLALQTGIENETAARVAADLLKVDKVAGKQLSTEDYSTAEKSKLGGIAANAQVNVLENIKRNGVALPITAKGVDIAVPTKVSDLSNDSGFITSLPDATNTVKGIALLGVSGGAARYGQKGDVGLGNVDNTTDANKPISIATATALTGKLSVYNNSIGGIVNADVRINRDLGFYAGGDNISGIIKITLPVAWTNTMMSIVLDIYQYNTEGASQIIIGGYNYNYASGSWVNTTAEVSGTMSKAIRLAYDGTNVCILLGNLSSIWNLPKIIVSKIIATYNNPASLSAHCDINLITSETGLTIVTPTRKEITPLSYVTAATQNVTGTQALATLFGTMPVADAITNKIFIATAAATLTFPTGHYAPSANITLAVGEAVEISVRNSGGSYFWLAGTKMKIQ